MVRSKYSIRYLLVYRSQIKITLKLKSVCYLKLSLDLVKICFCTRNVACINNIYFHTGSNPKNIEEDPELKNWGKELGTPTGQAGAGIKVGIHSLY